MWERLGFGARDVVDLLKISVPVVLTFHLEFLLPAINILFLGHLSALDLAASTLGNLYCNTTGTSWAFGLITASDTLCSQAFGAGQRKRAVLVSLRATFILSLCCLPVAALWVASKAIMLHLDQQPEVVTLAYQYILIRLSSMWPQYMFEVWKKHLQAQGKTSPPMVILIATTFLDLGVISLMVLYFELGFISAPLAIAITQWFAFLALIVYIIADERRMMQGVSMSTCAYLAAAVSCGLYRPRAEYRELADTKSGETPGLEGSDDSDAEAPPQAPPVPSGMHGGLAVFTAAEVKASWQFSVADVCHQWWEYIKLGLAGASQTFLEWGCFEIAALMVGMLGTVSNNTELPTTFTSN